MSLRRALPSRSVVASLALAAGLLTSSLASAQSEPDPDGEPSPPAALPPAPPPPAPPSPQPQSPPGTTISTEGPVVIRVGPPPASPPPASPPPVAPPVAPDAPIAPVTEAPRPGEPYEDHDLDTPYPRRAHFMMRTGLGPSFYSFHGDRLIMGGLDMTLGADTKAGSYGANLGFAWGKTEPGLTAWRFDIGADLEWPIGPVRLGIGPRFGVFEVNRITTSSPFAFVTVGLVGVASVDLIQSDGFALALSARPSVEAAMEFFTLHGDNGGALMGVSTFLEFRFRAPKGPPKPPKRKNKIAL